MTNRKIAELIAKDLREIQKREEAILKMLQDTKPLSFEPTTLTPEALEQARKIVNSWRLK